MKTSDKGTITYKYNSMGECIYTNECGRVYQTTGFDEQGRVTEKKVGAYVVKYRYGTSDEDANKLVEKALYDPSNKLVSKTSYYYDEYGRVEQEEKYIAKTGNSFWTDYTYNQFGELNSVNGITYEYDCYGNKVDVLSVSQRQTGPGIYEDVKKTLWHMSKNKGKSCEATLFGDGGLKSEYTYDDAGRLTNSLVSYRGSSICSLGYEYDKNTGNMTTRSGMMGKTEKFFYDDLDRLNVYCSLDGRTQSVDYSGSGNIINKSDLGTYRYQYLFKPNCLTQLDNEEGTCPLDTREISYNVWNRVSKIKDSASGYELQFEYDEDGNRIWSKLTKNGVWLREIEYAGNVEHIMTNTSDDYFTYLGDNLVCHDNDFTSEILYLCTDHLGSIVKIVNEQGNACFEAKYDAWGNQKIIKNDIGFIRGYTGHEEMPEFGLVNMNARLYDPMLGRFLSPDDFVQMPENSQNFNRYAYCLNNPLKYSDPSGNFVFPAVLAVAAIVSFECGLTSWAMNRDFGTGAVQGFTTIMFSQGISGTQVIGEGFGHNVGSLWNEAFRAGFHGLWQGFNGQKDGGDFKTDFLAGFVSSLTGSVVGGGNLVTLGATTLSGGLVELAFDGTGNAFLRGAKIGLEIGALNHCGGDWYEDEEGNLKCFYSCSPKVKSKGRIWRNKGHVLTKNGKYYSLFGQRYEKGSRNGRFARLLDEGVMNTARYEAIASVESSSGYYTSEQINPAMTDFSNFCIDTGMLPDNAVYYDYGGYKGNACITFKTNTANMLVCATNFSANGIRGIEYSAYNMMFSPLHVDRPVDTVRFWFKGGEGGLKKYNFYQKLVNSYK